MSESVGLPLWHAFFFFSLVLVLRVDGYIHVCRLRRGRIYWKLKGPSSVICSLIIQFSSFRLFVCELLLCLKDLGFFYTISSVSTTTCGRTTLDTQVNHGFSCQQKGQSRRLSLQQPGPDIVSYIQSHLLSGCEQTVRRPEHLSWFSECCYSHFAATTVGLDFSFPSCLFFLSCFSPILFYIPAALNYQNHRKKIICKQIKLGLHSQYYASTYQGQLAHLSTKVPRMRKYPSDLTQTNTTFVLLLDPPFH